MVIAPTASGIATPGAVAGGVGRSQQIAVPAYFNPGPHWDRMQRTSPVSSLAIVNPASGPGPSRSEVWARQIDDAKRAGMSVIGYVPTGYGSRLPREVKADVRRYLRWYPALDGIFLDEGRRECRYVKRYRALVNFIESRSPNLLTTLLFGRSPQRCYSDVADLIVNFEGDSRQYREWSPKSWERGQDPSRFWHLVYDTPLGEAADVVALSKEHNAGWIYVTPDVLPNPWDTTPPDPYWWAEVSRSAAPR